MEEVKMCRDGEFIPAELPCPPPTSSGPNYYYHHYNNPADGINGGQGGGPPISAGALAAIIILAGLIIVMLSLFAIKFSTRLLSESLMRPPSITNIQAARNFSTSNAGDVVLAVAGGGLEEKLVNLLPIFEYSRCQDDGKQLLNHVPQKLVDEGIFCGVDECAVCLSLFEEKDMVRVLPKCKHVFHVLCIDKWFGSHANCPLCREGITLQTIQLFLQNSQDMINNIDDGENRGNQPAQDIRLANLDLRTCGGNRDDERDHRLGLHDDYHDFSISQQETQAVAGGAPSVLPSAGDDGLQITTSK